MGNLNIHETFDSGDLNKQLQWHCEPSKKKIENGQLLVSSDAGTDFWQKTHYGFEVDNGHFLHASIEGGFTMETQMHCEFKNQYDQAGLMVRISPECWVKTSVEFEPDESNKLGAVVTNHGFSDWSTQDVNDEFTDFKIRITRHKSDYFIHFFSLNSNDWIQIRMFHLFDQPKVQAGLYCCSPKNDGFKAHFDYLRIE